MENSKKIEILKQYFESNKGLQSIILCEDGNVFYKEAEHYAAAHCKQNKLKSETVTRIQFEELIKGVSKTENKEVPKQDKKPVEKKEDIKDEKGTPGKEEKK